MRNLFVLLSFFFICDLKVTAELLKQSSIVIKNPMHDFGVVSQGNTVKHSFALHNSGNSDLKINRVITGCGCTAGKIEPEAIEPGKTGSLLVEFDSTNFSGHVSKYLTLLTNDPLNERVQLTIKGTVEADLVIEPAQIVLPSVIKTSEKVINATQIVQLSLKPNSKLKFGAAKATSKNLIIEKLAAADQQIKLSISLTNDVVLGEIRDRVVVELVGRDNPQLVTIPVFASVSGPVKLAQSVVSYGVISTKDLSEPLKRSVKLENFDALSKLAINSIESNHPALTVKSVPIVPGQSFVLHLALDPKQVTKDVRTTVRINTNLDAQPLVLNILAVVPPAL